MSSHHNNGEFDSPLENDLDTISQEYRQLGQEEPPALLDQAILNKAHRAVEKQAHWTQFGWLHGLTTAAVIVLAMTVVFQQSEPVPELDDVIPMDQDAIPSTEITASQAAAPAQRLRAEKKTDAQEPESNVQTEELRQIEFKEEISLPAPALIQTASDQPLAKIAAPALTEPEAGEAQGLTLEKMDPDSEFEAILELKQAGDESWRQALAEFIERYPDYPLPEGIQD